MGVGAPETGSGRPLRGSPIPMARVPTGRKPRISARVGATGPRGEAGEAARVPSSSLRASAGLRAELTIRRRHEPLELPFHKPSAPHFLRHLPYDKVNHVWRAGSIDSTVVIF